MPSIQMKKNSKFWHCAIYRDDGSRTTRSTGTKSEKAARRICIQMEADERIATRQK